MIANTMLKHRGVCRAAGGEKPPKREGGGSERQRAGDYALLVTFFRELTQLSE